MLKCDSSPFYNTDLFCHVFHKIPLLGLFRSTIYHKLPQDRILFLFRQDISPIQSIGLFQNPVKHSVKSPKRNSCPLYTCKFQESFFHFYCRRPGKSHNKNRGSWYLPILDHMCCSLYNDGSFPRTGACQNHHWS